MSIPASHQALREALNELSPLSRKTGASNFDNKDPKFNHPFSRENGVRLSKIQLGHIEAELETDLEKNHDNSHGSLHGGVLQTATDAVMAATAQSTISKKDTGKIAVVRDFAIRFLEPVLPGDKFTIISDLKGATTTESGKEIKFIESEVRDKNHQSVARAIASCFIVDKSEHLAS